MHTLCMHGWHTLWLCRTVSKPCNSVAKHKFSTSCAKEEPAPSLHARVALRACTRELDGAGRACHEHEGPGRKLGEPLVEVPAVAEEAFPVALVGELPWFGDLYQSHEEQLLARSEGTI